MPRYLIERLFDQRKEKLGPSTSQRSMRLAEERFPELAWEHSHVVESDEEGAVRTFCIYRAPNEEMLREHALAVGNHVVLNLYELAGDVAPADVPREGQPVPGGYFS
jgi:hypothetical protein